MEAKEDKGQFNKYLYKKMLGKTVTSVFHFTLGQHKRQTQYEIGIRKYLLTNKTGVEYRERG